MTLALTNGRMFIDGVRHQRALLIENDRILAVTRNTDPRLRYAKVHDLKGALILPGFIDVQVNGGGGVLFNDHPTIDGIRVIGAAHRRFGTTGFLPTLISDDLGVVAKAIAAVRSAMAAGVPGVLGIHIEGPFLSEARKGAHDAAVFRRIDEDAIKLLSSLRTGTTLVTLAPELTTPQIVAQLSAAGVIVAAGHTDATYAEVGQALSHGLAGFTHLFNAMSPLRAREPGVVGAALYDDDSYCGIIVDGHHVDPVVLQLALRAKRHDRLMLVTDAMPCAGTDLGSFQLQGRTINVVDGCCVDERGTLIGTTLTMIQAVKNAAALLALDLSAAVRMASEYPAAFLRLAGTFGRIAPGYRANLVITDDDLNVFETWIDGRCLGAHGDASGERPAEI
jgi:N-acetylglucosamine-6-phosphate deacetylase